MTGTWFWLFTNSSETKRWELVKPHNQHLPHYLRFDHITRWQSFTQLSRKRHKNLETEIYNKIEIVISCDPGELASGGPELAGWRVFGCQPICHHFFPHKPDTPSTDQMSKVLSREKWEKKSSKKCSEKCSKPTTLSPLLPSQTGHTLNGSNASSLFTLFNIFGVVQGVFFNWYPP